MPSPPSGRRSPTKAGASAARSTANCAAAATARLAVAILAVVNGILVGACDSRTEPARTVLFVCEHGAAKSVVAAAHFNRLAVARGLRFRAISRGTVPDREMAPAAIAGLREDGLLPAGTAPSQLTQADLDAAARVISFCDLPADLTSPVPVERWEVPPVSTGYAASRTAMVVRIEKLLGEIGNGGRESMPTVARMPAPAQG